MSFRFTNTGTLMHEAFIGSETEQAEHAQQMASESASGMGHSDDMAGMDHSGHHMDAASVVQVAAGATGELTYTFDEAGTYVIGCHQPGHWAAGMRATVTVA